MRTLLLKRHTRVAWPDYRRSDILNRTVTQLEQNQPNRSTRNGERRLIQLDVQRLLTVLSTL